MKECSRCNKLLDLSMFDNNRNQCKNCRKEILKINNKKYYNTNKSFLNGQHKEYNEENKERIKKYRIKYNILNKDKNAKCYAIWYKKNLEKIKHTQNNYQKNRKQTDIIFKLRSNISSSIAHALKSKSSTKNNSSILNYLPYTIKKLKTHIENQFEPWMNWNNQGKFNSKVWNENDSSTWTWQLDHIIPQSNFSYSSMADENFRKCWALENLRPLSAKQNLLKGNR